MLRLQCKHRFGGGDDLRFLLSRSLRSRKDEVLQVFHPLRIAELDSIQLLIAQPDHLSIAQNILKVYRLERVRVLIATIQ